MSEQVTTPEDVTKDPFEHHEYLAVGANCWGWGKTPALACIKASEHGPYEEGFNVYFANSETTQVGDVFGEVRYTKDNPIFQLGRLAPMVRSFILEGSIIVTECYETGQQFEVPGFGCEECDKDPFRAELIEQWRGPFLDLFAKCYHCGHEYPISRRPFCGDERLELAWEVEEELEEDEPVPQEQD